MTTTIHRRALTSYAKVQTIFGNLIRGRPFQLRRDRVVQGKHLDIGCGRNAHETLINLDYLWHPEVDICWDITKGLPFADGSMKGIFSEHCLEHFPLQTAFEILKETRRVLSPGGRIRIVVPDGELYLSTYNRQNSGE